MVYLDACIKESLRKASAPCGAARYTHEDFEFKDVTVPKDSIVLISRYLIHHDELNYSDPNSYIPERYLDKKVSKYAYIPFGGGAHSCPGRFYAIFAVKMLVALTLRSFDISVEGKRPAYRIIGNEVRSQKAKITFTRKQ